MFSCLARFAILYRGEGSLLLFFVRFSYKRRGVGWIFSGGTWQAGGLDSLELLFFKVDIYVDCHCCKLLTYQ